MIKDLFCFIDNNPIVLKSPIMPFLTTLQILVYRIPIFVNYNPEVTNWPNESWYSLNDININAVLIGGRRFPCMQKLQNGLLPLIPDIGCYTIHVEDDASYIVIGSDLSSLWIYEKMEVVLTSKSSWSLYGSRDLDGDSNPPMILDVPNIKNKADALKYARFNFETLKMNFIKEGQNIKLFGGEMRLSLRLDDINSLSGVKDFSLGLYIVDKISYDMNEVAITGIDWRMNLNRKYPTNIFTRTEYIYLEDDYLDMIKPECIGINNGVPGIPINGLQIYDQLPSLTKITYYDFRFPPGWEELYKIEVLNGDRWTEVYPGRGSPAIKDGAAQYITPNPDHPVIIEYIDGIPTGKVSIYFLQVLNNIGSGSTPVDAADWASGLKKVRMYARWPNSDLRDAINTLLNLADPSSSLSEGFNGEFDGLAPIGIYMDSSEPLFNWIEKLQGSNILGGQLIVKNNNLYFRLENPNRAKVLDIPETDVINHETLSIENADEFWYSGWDITYKKSLIDDIEKSEGHLVGNNPGGFATAQIYTSEDSTVCLNYIPGNPPEQSFNIQHLQKRANIISDMVKVPRHRIKNLQVPVYPYYLNLLLYDVVGYLPKVLKDDYSNTLIDWMIYEKKLNMKRETISLTLVERKKSESWQFPPP